MSPTTYAQAVNGALDRLQTTGFYLGNTFANHGPMAAEALALSRHVNAPWSCRSHCCARSAS
jgi:hypothetical protein